MATVTRRRRGSTLIIRPLDAVYRHHRSDKRPYVAAGDEKSALSTDAEPARGSVGAVISHRMRGGATYGRLSAFTLVELLVVIAIIAILAALLLPSLNKARMQATSVACLNNFKNLYTAMVMYTDESDGFCPPYRERFVKSTGWNDTIQYSRGGFEVFETTQSSSGSGIYLPIGMANLAPYVRAKDVFYDPAASATYMADAKLNPDTAATAQAWNDTFQYGYSKTSTDAKGHYIYRGYGGYRPKFADGKPTGAYEDSGDPAYKISGKSDTYRNYRRKIARKLEENAKLKRILFADNFGYRDAVGTEGKYVMPHGAASLNVVQYGGNARSIEPTPAMLMKNGKAPSPLSGTQSRDNLDNPMDYNQCQQWFWWTEDWLAAKTGY